MNEPGDDQGRAQPDENAGLRQPSPIRESGAAAGAKNFALNFWNEAKPILVSPRKFFENMPESGGMNEPALFMATAAGINALLTGILSMNMMIMFLVFGSSIIGVFLGAAVASAISSMWGGKGTFEGTFRVFAYSLAPVMFGWLHMAVGVVAGVYTLVLNYFGLRKVQGMSEPKTIMVVILSGIIASGVMLLGACTVVLRSVLHF